MAFVESAGIGGNKKSTSARGFDVTPLLEYAKVHGLYDEEPEIIYGRWVDEKVAAAEAQMHPPAKSAV